MRSLIAGLLQYTRINTSGNLSHANLAIILEEVIENLNDKINLYQAKIKINELPTVYCCPLNISLLFQNLISNSIKFTENDHQPSIEISCEERVEDWLFKIQDNGIGIPKKDLNEIFIMYRRLHNQDEYNGFGVGLAHCKRIVELHNGELWAESILGEGSIFYFTISKKI
jgi:light-regulated signal transduction histidine kinase (bacteriophytochrome)